MADDPNAPQVPMQPGPLPPQLFGGTPQMPTQGPSSADDLTSSMVAASQLGQQQFEASAQRRAALASQLSQLQQQQQGLQTPQTGYRPQFQPADSVGHVLGDVGKGLLLGLSATGPGRAVQQAVYGPGEREYQMRAGSLANQIAEIQKQMGSESEAMGAATGMTAKPMQVAGRVAVAEMNNQTRQLHDRNMETLKGQLQQIQKDLGNKKITAEEARTRAEILIGQGHDKAIQSVAGTYSDQRDRDAQVQAEEKEWGEDITGIKQMFGGLFGAAPPPSQRPAAPPGPKARGSAVPTQKSGGAQHTPGGSAQGLQEGATGTGSDGKKYVVKGGTWVAQ